MADESKKVYGYLVEFETPHALVQAAKKVRDAGYKKWDTFSPFPVHGIDPAMGIRRTIIPWIVLGAGLTGLATAFAMQYGLNGIDYPIVVSGKPLMSLPAFIPIMFELTVLFSALAAVGSLIVINGLPMLYHPIFKSPRFNRVTNDRFFLAVEAEDEKFSEEKTQSFLSSLGGIAVERVED